MSVSAGQGAGGGKVRARSAAATCGATLHRTVVTSRTITDELGKCQRAALMLEHNPALRAEALRAMLMKTARARFTKS